MRPRGSLGEIGESISNALLRRAGRLSSRYQEQRGLESDLLESDDAFLAVFDAPGATAGDVQVRYVDGSVLVRIDRFRDYHEGFEMRFPGRGLALDGELELPEGAAVDAAAANATLTEVGTLEVRIPKREAPPGDLAEEDADGTGIEEAVEDEDAAEKEDTAEDEEGTEEGEDVGDDGEGEAEDEGAAESEDDAGNVDENEDEEE